MYLLFSSRDSGFLRKGVLLSEVEAAHAMRCYHIRLPLVLCHQLYRVLSMFFKSSSNAKVSLADKRAAASLFLSVVLLSWRCGSRHWLVDL